MFKKQSTTKIFNDLGMPIPKFSAIVAPLDYSLPLYHYTLDPEEANVITYLDYWTAIMEWPLFQYYLLFALTGTIIGTMGVIGFTWKYL